MTASTEAAPPVGNENRDGDDAPDTVTFDRRRHAHRHRSRRERARSLSVADAAALLVLATLAYLPSLLTAPGLVAADTKQYLYLDPGRLMGSALSMWDPSVAGGEVTHQNIGYLLPQGPFYWLLAELHVPTWVAQRLWLGTLLFAAGTGVWFLARVLGLGAPAGAGTRDVGTGASGAGIAAAGAVGPLVAGVVYMLSPYFLQYVQRISAIVMPWSGLGWMLAFTVLALRRGGWRYPALFGIVVALVGGTNATSLLYVGIAPALYVPHAAFVSREVTARRALAALLRLGVTAAAVSVWWIAALAVEGAYGIDVLRFTETVPAVASTSLPSEVLRGLGYWYFYGVDQLGPWLTASVDYETRLWLLATSFAVPALAFVAAVVTRWRHRAYFVGLVLVGLVLSVGTYPYNHPGLLGSGLRAFMSGTTAGFALRSTDRATPLVLLGLAVLAGAGAAALSRRVRAAGLAAGALAATLAIVNAAPFLTGAAVEQKFSRPENLPSYVAKAAGYLDSQGDSTRVLFEPGQDFASYDFGTTTDSIWPGVMTRPTIERQQLIDGSLPTADLLDAFDLTLQQGTYEPATLAPIARLLSAGDVVLQSELAYWWYATPKPEETWPLLSTPPAGVGTPVAFGPPTPDAAPSPYENINDATLALPARPAQPPALAVFPVSGARPIYRAEPASAPLVVDGDGNGVVAAAATGLLDANPTVFYAGTLDSSPTLAREVLTPGAQLVLTDTNGKELRRWSTVQDNIGALEPAVQVPAPPDASAIPLVMFPKAPASSYTTAVYGGALYVTASGYGNEVSYTPEDRPYEAFDGDPSTAWTTGAFSVVEGSWIQLALPHPITVDHLDLVQPLGGDPDRWITKATITFDGGRPVHADLGAASRTVTGQTIPFPARSFSTLRITVDRTNRTGASAGGSSGVGFAEIRVPGVQVHESVALPTDLLGLVGTASISHRVTVVLTRNRVSPIPPRADPEAPMSRIFELPTARTFEVSGTARISALIADNLIDDLLAGPKVFGGAVIGSDARLPGDLDARAIFAFDGNPATAWMPGFGATHQVGAWMEMGLPHPVRFDHLDLRLVADGRHSVPTAIRITSDKGSDVLVPIPPVKDSRVPGATVRVPVSFPTVTGSVVRFTIAAVRAVTTPDYYSGGANTMPVGIAELGVPGLRFAPENPDAPLPDVCRTNLLRIDGRPVGVRVLGTVREAETLQGLRVVGCGSAAAGVALGPGRHTLETAPDQVGGYDLDRLVLDSAPGGGPMPLAADGSVPTAPGTLAGSTGSPVLATPAVKVLSGGATSSRLQVSGASTPFWLVLGESVDAGWQASVEGGAQLGGSQLVDGYGNGWFVTPPAGGGPFVIDVRFAPQGEIWAGIAVSGATLAACLVLALWPRRRRRRPAPLDLAGPDEPSFASPLTSGGHRPRLVAIVALSVVAGLVAGSLPAPPWGPVAGVAVGAAVALTATFSRSRWLLALAAVGCAVAAGVLTTARQATVHLPANGAWPAHFAGAAALALFAVLALAADALVELARRGRPARTGEEAPARGGAAAWLRRRARQVSPPPSRPT